LITIVYISEPHKLAFVGKFGDLIGSTSENPKDLGDLGNSSGVMVRCNPQTKE
jgi:hypothetical protein